MFDVTLFWDGLLAIILIVAALFGSKTLNKEEYRYLRRILIIALVVVACLVLFDLLSAIWR